MLPLGCQSSTTANRKCQHKKNVGPICFEPEDATSSASSPKVTSGEPTIIDEETIGVIVASACVFLILGICLCIAFYAFICKRRKEKKSKARRHTGTQEAAFEAISQQGNLGQIPIPNERGENFEMGHNGSNQLYAVPTHLEQSNQDWMGW